MIIDIGGGTTEIAIISLSGIANGASIRVAGDELNISIVEYFRKNYNILVGERTAEDIKCQVGSVMPLKEEVIIEVKGRDLVSGLPKMTEVSSIEIREALSEPVNQIIRAVKVALENTQPELASDILDRGIMLSGGGALRTRRKDKARDQPACSCCRGPAFGCGKRRR
jgi:rod shape-determining protein MreB